LTQQVETIVGVDEAGRGPLAGPVVAAAVILDPNDDTPYIDSKQCSESKRHIMAAQVIQRSVDWSVGIVSPEEIDQVNILQATMLAMQRAIEQLIQPFDYILVDGNRLPDWSYQSRYEIKGDQRFRNIAAASIIAKVFRDQIMLSIDNQYPQYGFIGHKGYPTVKHMHAIETHGVIKEHRLTFKPVAKVLKKITL
jgi:ribonuclease HII